MANLSWIVNNIEYPLENINNGLYLLSYDGFGVPDFHRFEERGPLQHGTTDRGYRLDNRIITLVLGITGEDARQFRENKLLLTKIFKPTENTPGILRYTENDGYTREIQGYLIGGLEYNASDSKYLYQKESISIKCPDPAWYDPDLDELYFAIGGGTDVFSVPMVVPFKLGVSTVNMSQSIEYRGTVNSYPVITIAGPIRNCCITNESTGDKLDFTGVTIPAGETYTINLAYGYKTIVNSSGQNKIADLTADSDLATFSIEPDPVVFSGINSIHISGVDVTASTEIVISYYERYISI